MYGEQLTFVGTQDMNGLPNPDRACPKRAIQYHAEEGVESVITESDDKQQRRPPDNVRVAPR